MNHVPLAKDHEGMRVNYVGFLKRVRATELIEHLTELGKRYYAGDIAVVDEFLQLYCIAEEDRKKVDREPPRAPVLLEATLQILKACDEALYAATPFEVYAHYDEADCDAHCLADEIAIELGFNDFEDYKEKKDAS